MHRLLFFSLALVCLLAGCSAPQASDPAPDESNDLDAYFEEEPADNERSLYQIKKKMNQRNSGYSLELFKKGMQYFRAFPQSAVKRMRNSYILGEKAMEHLIMFEASRQRYMPDDSNSDGSVSVFDEAGCAKWYDILEMWDLYTDMDDEQDRRGDR